MSGPGVRVVGDGVTAEVVLDRRERLNALDLDDMRSLRGLLVALAGRPGLRAVMLRGEGRAFCAGRDVSGVVPSAEDAEAVLREVVHPLLAAVRGLPVPVVAAVQGACLGVGLGLASSCDVVWAGHSARIGSPFARLGAVPDSGAHLLLLERLGPLRAMELILTGELLSGEEAARVGLVSRALGDDELLPSARDLVARLADGPTLAFAASKRLLTGLRGGALAASLEAEAVAQGELSGTADYAEGFAAFQQHRSPRFTGHPHPNPR